MFLGNTTPTGITSFANNTRHIGSELQAAKVPFLIFSSFITLSFLFNFTVLLVFICFPSSQRTKIPNIALFVQSMSDMLLTITMTLYITTINPFTHSGIVLPGYYLTTFYFFYEYTKFLSFSMLLLLTAERFLAIKLPFYHYTHITINKYIVAVFFVFILSSILAILYTIYIIPSGNYHSFRIYNITMSSIFITIVTIINTLLLIFYYTIKKSIDMRIQQQEERTNTTNTQERKKNFRIFVIVLTMSTVYTITYTPMVVYELFNISLRYSTSIRLILLYTFNLLYFSSALVNPLLTLFFKVDFRNTLFKLFKRNRQAPAQHNHHHQQQHEQEQQTEHHIEVTSV